MKSCIALFVTIFLITNNDTAQIYLEPIAGFQADMNNGTRFKQINSGMQAAFRISHSYELIVRVQNNWALSNSTGSDSSFTVNPALPLYAAAKKTIRAGAWYYSIDHRFILNTKNKKQQFSILFHTGVSTQQLIVNYQYDKS